MDGMFINTTSPAPIGTHVNLIFPSEDKHEIEVAALVVWNREKSSYQKSGMGVQFLTPLPQAVKTHFFKYVDRLVILSEKGVCS